MELSIERRVYSTVLSLSLSPYGTTAPAVAAEVRTTTEAGTAVAGAVVTASCC